jgi:hypothetical protein
MRRVRLVLGVGAVALGVVGVAPGAASAATNGPLTRDCSLLIPAIPGLFGGLDPDFIQLSGAVVNGNGSLATPSGAVQVTASESADPGDNRGHVALSVTVTAPNIAARTFTGEGTGAVTLSIPLVGAPNQTYTVDWAATFDGGFHPCPGLLTLGNITANPFKVVSPL